MGETQVVEAFDLHCRQTTMHPTPTASSVGVGTQEAGQMSLLNEIDTEKILIKHN